MTQTDTLFFTKMHGLGNDFIFLDLRQHPFDLSSLFIKKITDRRRGIGCDQVIVLEKPTHSDATVMMRIFNRDGTEVGACGNGTRCLGAFLTKETGQHRHFIETKERMLLTETTPQGVKVTMGKPVLEWQSIPLQKEVDPLFLPIHVQDLHSPIAVSMGNPHLVFFVDTLQGLDLERLGKELTHHPLFPEGTNVEFAEIKDRNHVKMRVWERGTGITQSCATGACAVVVAGVLRGALDPSVTVHLDGGDLFITYDDIVTVSGPVSFVFEGHFYLHTPPGL